MEKYEKLNDFIKKNKIQINYENITDEEFYLMNNIIEKNNIIESENKNILYFNALYLKYNYKDLVKKNLLKAIELNNSNAIVEYVSYLEKEEEIKKYLLKAIELNNSEAMTKYGLILKKENKIEEAKEYYLKAIELNNSNAMNNYAVILQNENKINEAIKYYLKAIELNNKTALDNYLELKLNNIKKYIDLSSISTSQIIEKKIIELEKEREVLIYKNKIKRHSEIKECELCFVNKLNIELNCFNHMICIDCYPQIYDKKCPFCRL